MTKVDLIDWLVRWRAVRGGSISEHNHRRLLRSRTAAELGRMKHQIEEQERRADGQEAPKE